MTLTAHADTYALDLIVPPKILLHRICRMQEKNTLRRGSLSCEVFRSRLSMQARC